MQLTREQFIEALQRAADLPDGTHINLGSVYIQSTEKKYLFRFGEVRIVIPREPEEKR